VDRLQVLNPQTSRVTIGHLKAGVPKDTLEVQHIPARPQIAHRKRMPKRVWGESDAYDTRLFAEQLHIPPYVAVTCHDSGSGREHEII
jgi:hypothetical protein